MPHNKSLYMLVEDNQNNGLAVVGLKFWYKNRLFLSSQFLFGEFFSYDPNTKRNPVDS